MADSNEEADATECAWAVGHQAHCAIADSKAGAAYGGVHGVVMRRQCEQNGCGRVLWRHTVLHRLA